MKLSQLKTIDINAKEWHDNLLSKYQIQDEYKIIIRNSIKTNCLKKELNK